MVPIARKPLVLVVFWLGIAEAYLGPHRAPMLGQSSVLLLRQRSCVRTNSCAGLRTGINSWRCTSKDFDEFLTVYSGEFRNENQRVINPFAPVTRKVHRRIELPSLGENTFYVHEETVDGDLGEKKTKQFCSRVSALSAGPEAESFKARYWNIKNEELEAALQSEANWARLDSLSPDTDLELDEGGTVVFRQLPGQTSYEAKEESGEEKTSSAQPMQIETTSVLSPDNWSIRSVFRDEEGALVKYTEIIMDKILQED